MNQPPEDQREDDEPPRVAQQGEIDFALVFERIATALEQIAFTLKQINKKLS